MTLPSKGGVVTRRGSITELQFTMISIFSYEISPGTVEAPTVTEASTVVEAPMGTEAPKDTEGLLSLPFVPNSRRTITSDLTMHI